MPAVGSFLANMLLGGLQEGQRRREAQTTVLPHLLNLLATQQYREATLGLGERKETRMEEAQMAKEAQIPPAYQKKLADLDAQIASLQPGTGTHPMRSFFAGAGLTATPEAQLQSLQQQRDQLLKEAKAIGFKTPDVAPTTPQIPTLGATSTPQDSIEAVLDKLKLGGHLIKSIREVVR